MHMSDALVSAPVALTAAAGAAALLVAAGTRIKKSDNSSIIPLMGVTGAFVFAAQMVNFAIPGTGSSGHIVGGVLLAALLGPWAAFITIASVLIIQCLVFADGGLMALGCNILNMGAMTTLIAYPLIFRPIAGNRENTHPSTVRLAVASIAACVVGLELGAAMVTLETGLSGITALPTEEFWLLMAGIHLPIGLGEGIATAVVLGFVASSRPDLLFHGPMRERISWSRMRKPVIIFAIATVLIGGGLAFLASSYPDGLEWTIQKISGATDLEPAPSAIQHGTEAFNSHTAFMPDYESSWSGIMGAAMVLIIVWAVSSLIMTRRKPTPDKVHVGGEERD